VTTHYCSHGRTWRALCFPCYTRELDAASARAKSVPGAIPGWTRLKVDPIGRTTSLDRVTCRECWASILAMALERTAALPAAKE